MQGEGRDVVKPKNWLESLNCAIEGVLYGFKTQKHMRYHFIIASIALMVSLILQLPILEFALFSVSIVILLFAEMMNTALEEVVNLAEQKYNVLAKHAKDASAGAVLLSAVGVVITSYMIFSKYIYESAGFALREASFFAGHIGVVSVLFVLISVVALKVKTGKGTPLHGGMPSGHAAVGFALATAITMQTLDAMIALFAYVLAAMVSHSRLIGAIHTKKEIWLGALLGLGVTLVIYAIFHYVS